MTTNAVVPTPGQRAITVLAMSVCAAALAGWLQNSLLAFSGGVLGQFRWVPRDYLWMAPIAYGLVLVAGGAGLSLLAALVRHRLTLPVSAMIIATVTTFGLLLPVSQISRAAALALAGGVGVQVFRIIARARPTWTRTVQRGALACALLVPALTIAQNGWRSWREARAVAALPPASTTAPNVLLIVLDAARARSLGFVTPAAGTTPKLDRWAESAAVFTNAFSVGPWTLPSHASMMSGRYATELAADWTVPIEQSHPVLPEILAKHGYVTAAFVANLHYTAWDSGLDRGFVHIDDYQRDAAQIIRSSAFTQTNLADTLLRLPTAGNLRAFLHPDLSIIRQHRYQSRLGGEVVDAFLGWRPNAGTRPWFALLNLMDPHLVTSADDRTRRRYPHDERGTEDYHAAMRYLDTELDRLLATLGEDGSLDRTLVIITADHGELLGEHGLHGHAQSLYRDVVHVPLFVRYPAAVPATRVQRAVSLRDLAATVLDLGGLTKDSLPGRSLRLAWQDSAAVLSPVFATARQQPNPLGEYPTAKGDLSGVFDERWSYIINHGTGQEQLFEALPDGSDSADLSADSTHASRLAAMRQHAALLREKHPDRSRTAK